MAPDYVALRLKTLTSLLAGEKGSAYRERVVDAVGHKLASLLGVAEIALSIAIRN